VEENLVVNRNQTQDSWLLATSAQGPEN